MVAGIDIQVCSYEERSMSASGEGGNAQACAFVEIAGGGAECYGVGIDANIVTASIRVLVSGVNRMDRTQCAEGRRQAA